MKTLSAIAMALVLLSSCSKKSDDPVNPYLSIPGATVFIASDTLSAGWSAVSAVNSSGGTFNDIFFTDNNNGFAAGSNGIYRSTNGGASWVSTLYIGPMINISAINNNRACFVSEGNVIKQTDNGGTNFIDPPVGGGSGAVYQDCFYSSVNRCYLTSKDNLWVSYDGGSSFTFQYSFSQMSTTASLFFINDMVGWSGRDQSIFKTTNGGSSWTAQTMGGLSRPALFFIDANNGYYASSTGATGSLYKTTNGGSNWQLVLQQNLYNSPGPAITDIHFVSVNEGYFSIGSRLYKTTDSGNTWIRVLALKDAIIEIHFTDATHGWVLSTAGRVIRYN